MVENSTKTTKPNPNDLGKILQERERLDQILQQKFKKEVTILFADICGYTEYIDRMGDICGRTMLLRYNRMVTPIVERHGGRVIEIIGDAIMAVFSSGLEAVEAAISIQRTLSENNKETVPNDRFHLKIGIASGQVLVDESADYQGFAGDVANIAARIQAQADSDQILLSKTVYDQLGESENILCRYHDTIQVKGKAQPLEIYQIVWQDEALPLNDKPTIQPHEIRTLEEDRSPPEQIQLEIARTGDRLKISAYEQVSGLERTIRHYEEIQVSMDMIQTKCHDMVDTLNKANRKGRVDNEALEKLRKIGQVLHDELFSLSVKEKLRETRAEYLNLNIDDQLVHIPWELLNDGRQFLCQRFNMGRLVKTRQPIIGARARTLTHPLRMLILADPEGDLKGAYAEGTQIRDYMDLNKYMINVSLRAGNIAPDTIKEKIRNFDIVHFAGHADYSIENSAESGWRLTGGTFNAGDITKMAGTATMPALIFSNACQSARTEQWVLRPNFEDEIFGLANAFLLAGVEHYVGTFWEILDEPSSRFALEFYKCLLSGMTIGETVRKSRRSLIKEYGSETIAWASYVLYGDPTYRYSGQIESVKTLPEPEPVRGPLTDQEVRAREEVIDFTDPVVKKRRGFRWSLVALLALLTAAILWGYPGYLRKGTLEYERAALAYYQAGDFKGALETCKILKDKNPKSSLPDVIQGNIHLAYGRLEEAEDNYRRANQSKKSVPARKAQALIGLGRIASLQDKPDLALKYYEQATGTAPENKVGYMSQALLLEKRKDYDQALDLFGKAHAMAPQDQVLDAITKETHNKATLARDKEKQERIDRIVRELLEDINSAPGARPADSWTSPPLTVWLMDFKTEGYALQEGHERLLVSGITDQLIHHSRARLVERALFDNLVEELKLGSSELIDQRTALSLGKLLASRIILVGQVIYSGPQVQISIRLIETETSQITGAINQSFGIAMPTSLLSQKLSEALTEKFKVLYPLRGKILEVKAESITLNVGELAGVIKGQRFKVLDKEVNLEIVSTEPNTSIAIVSEGKGHLQKNLRVEAIQ